MTLRALIPAGAIALAAIAGAPLAQAWWSSSSASGGAGQVAAQMLPQANSPSAAASGSAVAISWTPTSFAAATLDYEVLRRPAGGGPASVVSCVPSAGAGGSLTCSDDPVPAGTYEYTVRTALNAWRGPESSPSAPLTVYNDSTAPTTTATPSPSLPASGWFRTTPVSVTLSAIDDAGGSGVAQISYTLDGSDPRSSATALAYAGPLSITSTTTITFAAQDAANNWETPKTYTVAVDTIAPASGLSLSVAGGDAFLSGNTLWYRGVAAGSFVLANAVSDSGSGPASSTTSAVAAAGWTHSGGTTTTPSGGPYVSAAFSWAAGTTSAPTVTITSADVAGNTTSDALDFRDDSIGPTVTATATPAPGASGWNTGAVQLSLSAADNAGGAGVQDVLYTTDGSNPLTSSTASRYSAPISLSASATVRFAATDRVGNAGAPGSQAVQIDQTPPANSLTLTSVTGGAFLAGTTVFYRGAAAGSFAIANTLTDADSGAASSSSSLGGTTSGWTHTASTVTKRSGGAFVSNPFSWVAGTSSAPVATITGADSAGNNAVATLDFVDDSTSPTGALSFPAGPQVTSGAGWSAGCGTPVGDICGTAGDTGAGVATVSIALSRASDGKCWNPAAQRFQPSACAGVAPTSLGAAGWTVNVPCAADSYALDVSLTDNVGNSRALPRQAWQITSCA